MKQKNRRRFISMLLVFFLMMTMAGGFAFASEGESDGENIATTATGDLVVKDTAMTNALDPIVPSGAGLEADALEETADVLSSLVANEPFVLLSFMLMIACLSMSGLVFVKKQTRRHLAAVIGCTVLTVISFFLTTGWGAAVLANGGTLLVAAFATMTALIVFGKIPTEQRSSNKKQRLSN